MSKVFASTRGRVIAVVAGVVVLAGAPAAWAYWSSSQTVSGTSFTLGRMSLSVSPSPAISAASLYPGATIARAFTVTNTGNIPLTYYVTAQGADSSPSGLATAFAVKVTGDSATTGADPSSTCTGAALTPAATSIATASPAPLLGGSPQASRRPAAPLSPNGAGVDHVCVQLSLPSSAANYLQGAGTTVTLVFHAEQAAQP